METRIESVNCVLMDETVYIYDQDGVQLECIPAPPGVGEINAYSTGRGVVIERDGQRYIYSLRGRQLVQTSILAIPFSPTQEGIATQEVPHMALPPSESSGGGSSGGGYSGGGYSGGGSSGDGSSGCLWYALIIAAIVVCTIYEKGCSHNDGDSPPVEARREQTPSRGTGRGDGDRPPPTAVARKVSSEKDAIKLSSDMEWGYYKDGGHYVRAKGKVSVFTSSGYGPMDWYDAWLYLRKRSGQHEIFVVYNTSYARVPGDLSIGSYFFGENVKNLVTGDWVASTDRKAIFYAGNVTDLINSFRGQNLFSVGFLDNGGLVHTARFNVAGVFQKYLNLENGR